MLQAIAISMFIYGQNAKIKAIVVDDVTGEPLPYASVYATPEKGTMTNDEGEFSLDLDAGQQIRISYVGYETLNATTEPWKRTFRLKRLSTQMQEVTVLPTEKILTEVTKRLYKDYKRKKRKESNYFYQQLFRHNGNDRGISARTISGEPARHCLLQRQTRKADQIQPHRIEHCVQQSATSCRPGPDDR